MADSKTSALTSYSNPDPVNDVLPIVDNTNSTLKKISRNNLLGITSTPVGINDTQTLTAKTLTSPTIASPVLSGTITGTYTLAGTPTFPSTVVTLTGSQTLTNKVLTSPTINAPTITNASITADAITGFSTANSGTIYGMAITSGVLGANAVPTAGLQNASVTASKLATGAQTALVATSETTTSTTYADLATVTDTVTVTIGANGLALVIITCDLANSTGASSAYVSFAASGANTIAAADARSLRVGAVSGLPNPQQSWMYMATGMVAGSTTFKLKYRVTGNTGTYLNRYIVVVPL